MEREFKIKGLIMDPLTNSPIVILQSLEKKHLIAHLGRSLRGQCHCPAD